MDRAQDDVETWEKQAKVPPEALGSDPESLRRAQEGFWLRLWLGRRPMQELAKRLEETMGGGLGAKGGGARAIGGGTVA